jgi:hypothetical protein
MKTAIQEMIERLEKSGFFLISYDYDIFNEALEKEKQQIINACWYGHDIKHEYFNPIHYFDKTYPQNK